MMKYKEEGVKDRVRELEVEVRLPVIWGRLTHRRGPAKQRRRAELS